MDVGGTRLDVWALVLVMFGLLWLWHRNTRIRTRQVRSEMFGDCLDAIEHPVLEQDDVNFPILTGQYKGYSVRLEPVFDQMTFRKLPSLWMSLTVYRSIPVDGTFDYLVRPQNTEFYSPWSRLPYDLDIPHGWPPHAVLRSDVETPVPLELISPFIGVFQEDPKVKELLITKSGVRFVYQIDESQRSHYLVLRQPLFESLRVDKVKMQMLLDGAIDLSDTLVTRQSKPAAMQVDADRLETASPTQQLFPALSLQAEM
jgi:hypothetical protein